MDPFNAFLAAFSGLTMVLVSNPEEIPLELQRVERNSSHTVATCKGAFWSLTLPNGIYRLDLVPSEGAHRSVPIPLPKFASTPRVLRVKVKPWPEPRQGWAWIPEGPALMGDILGIGREEERPASVRMVKGLWVMTHEVTEGQYAEFLSDCKHIDPDWANLESRKLGLEQLPDGRWRSTQEMLPMVCVSAEGAEAYAEWMSRKTGKACRLPTEREWEKAARGPNTWVYGYGNVYTQKLANQESGRLLPVMQFAASPWGLHDLTGNAFEWVGESYTAPGSDGQPRWQRLKGGSFVLDGLYLRNAFRMRQRPRVLADDFGFRLVMEP